MRSSLTARRLAAPATAAAVVAVVIATYAGLRTAGVGQGPERVPFRPDPATADPDAPAPSRPTPEPAPAGTRSCRVSEMALANTSFRAAREQQTYFLIVTNGTGTACSLRGTPLVRIYGPDGNPVAVRTGRPPVDLGYDHPFLVPPGASARTVLDWESFCGRGLSSIRIEVRADDTEPGRRSAQEVAPGCGRNGSAPVLVSGWHLAPSAQSIDPDAPPNNPHDGAALTVEIEAPEEARAGRVISFVVRLGNPSSEEHLLDPCPTYRMTIGESATVNEEIHHLNCDAAPDAIPAVSSVEFEMRLRVPEESRGEVQLSWRLGANLTAGSSFASVPVRVAG